MGILWPHSNAIVFNNAGTRAPGAKAYFFEAGTTTPRTTYADATLTTPHTHPVLADGNGRFPAIFLDYGDYRERIRTAGDTAIWDTDNIPNAAPTDPAEGVDPDAILTTGDVFFGFRDGTRDGAVRANGKTIGSSTSSASERANDDTEALFTALYLADPTNTLFVVSPGRGANAAADFAADATITLPDLRGAYPLGLPTMGNSNNNFLQFAPVASGSVTTPGSQIGANTHTLTSGQLPAHAHAVSITTGNQSQDHTHAVNITSGNASQGHTHSGSTNNQSASHSHEYQGPPLSQAGLFAGGGGNGWGGSPVTINTALQNADHNHGFTTGDQSQSHTHNVNGSTETVSQNHTHLVSGNTGNGPGSGTQFNILSRGCTGTWYIKL